MTKQRSESFISNVVCIRYKKLVLEGYDLNQFMERSLEKMCSDYKENLKNYFLKN